jgi:hypothetical protein
MTEQDVAPQVEFDYGELCREDWQFVHDATDEIKRLGKQTIANILEIGRLLTEVKARLTHGQFCRWLAEFHSSERQAQRLMSAHLVFGKTDTMSDLASFLEPTAIYQLAAPSTPEPARQEVLAKVEAGEHVTPKAVKAIVDKHKPTKREKRLRQNLGDQRAAAFVERHPEIKPDPVVPALRSLEDALRSAKTTPEQWVTSIPEPERSEVDALLRGLASALDGMAKALFVLRYPEPDQVDLEDLIPPEPTQQLAEELADAAPGNGVDTPEAALSPTVQWMRDHPDDKPCPRDPMAARAWRGARGIQPPMKDYTCLACHEAFQGLVQRGQPPKFCPSCRSSAAARKKAKEAMRDAAS